MAKAKPAAKKVVAKPVSKKEAMIAIVSKKPVYQKDAMMAIGKKAMKKC